VTWKRDSLATRPIEILDAEAEQAAAPAAAVEETAEATEANQPAPRAPETAAIGGAD
jgi:hypothetical protein